VAGGMMSDNLLEDQLNNSVQLDIHIKALAYGLYQTLFLGADVFSDDATRQEFAEEMKCIGAHLERIMNKNTAIGKTLQAQIKLYEDAKNADTSM
jgi:hypothetical protein